MARDDDGGRRRLDATSLRALAHPLRIRILGTLRADGPATASGLGARLGESSGTTSWHLRQLHQHGFIEEDSERGNRRERWWKAAHRSTELCAGDFAEQQGVAGSVDTFLRSVAHENVTNLSRFLDEFLSGEWGREWHTAVTMSDRVLPLTPEESASLIEELHALVDRYERPRREGDTSVLAQYQVFPRDSGERE